MKTSKKILAVLLSLLLLAAIAPVVMAEDASGTDGAISWVYNDSTKTLTVSGEGNMKDYSWDDRSEDASPWVKCLKTAETIIVGSGIKYVGQHAFYHAFVCKELQLQDGIEEIGENAFANCTMVEKLIIPGSVKTLDTYAFFNCNSASSLTIRNGVKTIGDRAFASCNYLMSVSIPASVTYIGEDAFDKSDRIYNVYYSGSQQNWNAITVKDGNDYLLNAAKFKYNSNATAFCPWCGETHVEPVVDNRSWFFRLPTDLKDFFHRFFATIFGAKFK